MDEQPVVVDLDTVHHHVVVMTCFLQAFSMTLSGQQFHFGRVPTIDSGS